MVSYLTHAGGNTCPGLLLVHLVHPLHSIGEEVVIRITEMLAIGVEKP